MAARLGRARVSLALRDEYKLHACTQHESRGAHLSAVAFLAAGGARKLRGAAILHQFSGVSASVREERMPDESDVRVISMAGSCERWDAIKGLLF